MGLFSAIGSFIGNVAGALGSALGAVGRAIGGAISGICSAIGGGKLGELIAGGVAKLAAVIGIAFPPAEIINALILAAKVISGVAEVLGLKETGKDEPDELAMKAEKDDAKPDDFESTEAYIRHLQQEVSLTKEEKEKLKNLTAEEHAAYHATGTYLYTKAINEKLGYDTQGLKNPELIGITGAVITDLIKLQSAFSPREFVACNKYLQEKNLTMENLTDYLHRKEQDILIDKKVQDSIIAAVVESNPSMTKEDINAFTAKLPVLLEKTSIEE